MMHSASAQSVTNENPEVSTAILNTSIPFAIGAREGEQTIRGSFGWPTFQEGFVEGVYFRFDPDGYARFSSSPRLDEDVFEVRCQNASTICVAKKDGLEIGLTAQGRPQIRISGITPADRFFISDRKNELPLPNTILGPIDQRLETLLSSGGELIIRRELEKLQTLSLSGFSATVTYLRWVAQNQASFVFPRGWPAPSQQAGPKNNGLTLPDTWNNASSQNQLPPVYRNVQNQQLPVQQNQTWPNGDNQFGANSLRATPASNSDVAGIGFAQQARGRSLPADINRFEILPNQSDYSQAADRNPANQQINPATISLELNIINQSLRNLELKIDNLATRLSFELQSAKVNALGQNQSGSNVYAGVSNVNRSLSRQTEGLSEEEKLRKRVIESILQNAEQEPSSSQAVPTPPSAGEVVVKKNIVERLLEELNGTDQAESNVQEPATESSGDFISLSDYISKVMQAENRN
jgi:hypothetical protein